MAICTFPGGFGMPRVRNKPEKHAFESKSFWRASDLRKTSRSCCEEIIEWGKLRDASEGNR